jgi:hypothetical protein
LYSSESHLAFWRNISHPSSGSKSKPSKKPALLASCFTLFSCLAYSLTLKVEVIWSSETSDDFQWTAWHYTPKDRNFLTTLNTFY